MKKSTKKSIKSRKTRKNPKKTEIKGTPLLNTPFFFTTVGGGKRPEVNYKMLYNYMKTSPEIMSIISAITEDILSDGWELDGGRNGKKRAEKFLQDNFAKQQFTTFWIDALVTGDAYIWKAKLNDTDIKNAALRVFPKINIKSDVKNLIIDNAIEEIKIQDEDITKTRSFRIIPSSTMTAKWDKFGNVLKYIQEVGPDPKLKQTFMADEVIHFRYMQIDGKFYGFTPMQTLIQELSTLIHIKNFAQFFFEKGGIPEMMFNLEEEVPTSANYNAFKQSLQQWQADRNKHKSIVTCGKVTAVPLNAMSKDMEFRELARYMTQVIVMAWNIPSSRLSDLLISKGVKGSTTGTDGYYRKISHLQDIFQDVINSQLLNEFGVKLKFNKAYRQDEVREVQTLKIKADTCEQLLGLGLVNPKWCWNMLKIPEGMRGKPNKANSNKTGQLNQNLLNNHQVLTESPDKLSEDTDKQTAALRQKP